MWICEQDYVGITSADKNLSLIELGRTLSKLKQEYKEGNQTILDTPDELFDKFMAISTCLPHDGKGWPANLCSTFQSALTHDLGDAMANDTSFKQPELTSLTTKALQLDALRQVRAHAVTHFKKLQDQKTQIDSAVRSLMGSRRHGNIHVTNSEHNADQQSPHNTSNLQRNPSQVSNSQLHNDQQSQHGYALFQRNQSQAEQTMQRYKPNDRHDPGNKSQQPEVPTKFIYRPATPVE